MQIVGLPPRPVHEPHFGGVSFILLSPELRRDLGCFEQMPSPEHFNVYSDNLGYLAKTNWVGGETQALMLLAERLKVEQHAFERGYYLPNQARPNILDSPKSLSAYLRFGCLSVRRFYWCVHDLFRMCSCVPAYEASKWPAEHISPVS